MMGRVFVFCPLCGSGLIEKVVEHKTRPVCTSCDFIHYRNPIPASGVILVEDGQVLLVERKFEPRVGKWTLPAGFVEADEDAASCAVREMKEETNIDVELVRLFNVYSAFDDPRNAVVLILYLGKRIGGDLKCGDDASDARYFPVGEVPDEMIAFKAHKIALSDIRKQLAEGLL
jgi:ADP-ribose pyrophosphatase YjhB (NUDIX family)